MGIGVKVLDNTRDDHGDNPSFLLYTHDKDMKEVEVAVLSFEQAQTLSETLDFYVDVENRAFTLKYGDDDAFLEGFKEND